MRIVVPPADEPDEVELALMGKWYTTGVMRVYHARWMEEGDGMLISRGPEAKDAFQSMEKYLANRYRLVEAGGNEWKAEVGKMGEWLGSVLQCSR
jgi:hypothetical protein